MGHFVVTNVPLKILLKDTISERIAELIDDSVETRFGGVGLPTSIKYTDEILTDLSNFVIVQIHGGHTFVVINAGVTHVPVSVVLDGSVHEHFNLTHVLLGSVGERVDLISGVGELKDVADLANNLGGQLNALCLNEVAAHLKVRLHLGDELVECDGSCESEHGRFVWYIHNIRHVGREVNMQWTVRQVSLMSPLTTTSDGTRDTV